MWILGTNLIFAFPRTLWSSFRVPSYFDYRDATLFQLFEFLIHDFYGFFHKVELNIKLKFFHWNDKGFVRYAFLYIRNVEGVKFFSFSELDDTFLSLQALSDLHYLFGGFMDYLWSCELDISNFGPADR
ncbi:hypothetical protein Tco_1558547 [Tanacetum coccineum]